jgi:SAM-dependent methyltransferase
MTEKAKSETLDPGSDVREVVREKYGAIAAGQSVGCCSAGCGCNGGDVDQVLSTIGYTEQQAQAIPPGANLGLGCGNPLAFAEVKPGDVVLDLGSGGGLDVFLAAREVGPHGRAIGVDMTPAMIERARAAAAKHGHRNVEFRLGEIEHLPVADASVDLIISNCVVNLSPDKAQVFRETFRVLEPGGRLMVSDLVLRSTLTPEMQRSVDLYVGCVAGAALRDDYLRLIREAGFRDVEVVKEGTYDVGLSSLPPDSPERAAFDAVLSITVRAVKPSA